MNTMEAMLVLEDGRAFRGRAFGAPGERLGEIVFNTSMTGYQEILTDPSYAGQIVVMTYPHIGNYGINPEDVEARRVFLEGFVVREVTEVPSNWRAAGSLDEYLKAHGVVGISEIDTRALVRHIRERGAMRACISTLSTDAAELARRAASAPEMVGRELASAVTCEGPYEWEGDGPGEQFGAPTPPYTVGDPSARFHVVALDFGVKYNSLRYLTALGCRVTVLPSSATAAEILAHEPDGVFISNGPGDPATLAGPIEAIREVVDRQVPTFGICLGHQLIGHALGGRTFKLPFGHHGGNHPVKDLRTGQVEITAQNHGFAVAADSLPRDVVPTHLNLNDNTLEGLRHTRLPVFSVQYHPEAGPGPHDAEHLFVEFVDLMRARR
jgi:carbamoyl-phosphate synthase small subunit